ncbi:MAG: ribonucleotide reductase N-terminal alpha domain-containing protein [Rhodomicrobium sp.]
MTMHIAAASLAEVREEQAARVDMIPAAREIWKEKYRFRPPDGEPERCIEESWARVARAAAAVEAAPELKALWERAFYEALQGFKFLPGGQILAGAGTGRDVTLFNCFVLSEIGDSMESIFAHLREAALTLQQAGGLGTIFQRLGPKARWLGAWAPRRQPR